MNSLRIIHVDSAPSATIVASSTASSPDGSINVNNLKTDLKGQIHRSVGTDVTYTLTWAELQTFGGGALPATNLSAMSTIRMIGKKLGVTQFDTGVQYAAPGQNLGMWDWNMPLNANAFVYGGLVKSVLWTDAHYAIDELVIELSDPTNPAGYIDCSRLVVGPYWQPKKNPAYGASVSVNDSSSNSQNDAGDLLSDQGFLSDTMSLNFEEMDEQDRARMQLIFRANGVKRPMFIGLTKEGDMTSVMQQDWMIYGKRENSDIKYTNFSVHGSNLVIKGW